MARHEKKTQRRPILEIKVAHSGRRSDEFWTLFRCRTDTGQFPTPWRCLARQRGGWLVGCGVGGCGHLPDNIDAKERGRDIAEAPTNESRRTCTTIEIPAGLSGEALMMTTTRRRNVSDLRHAKAALGSKHHRTARRFRPRSSGTTPRKGSASSGLRAAA